MPLALPQPDFDFVPVLKLRFPGDPAQLDLPAGRHEGPGEDEDADPVGRHGKVRADLLTVCGERRW